MKKKKYPCGHVSWSGHTVHAAAERESGRLFLSRPEAWASCVKSQQLQWLQSQTHTQPLYSGAKAGGSWKTVVETMPWKWSHAGMAKMYRIKIPLLLTPPSTCNLIGREVQTATSDKRPRRMKIVNTNITR